MLFRELDPLSNEPRLSTLVFFEALGGPDTPE
jgi:hypothetical protein